jgi:hypothetical protein
MRATWYAALAVALIASTACGKSEEQKQSEAAAQQVKEAAAKFDEAAKEAAKQGEAGGAEIAKGLEAMAKGLANAASAVDANGKPVDPVNVRALQAFFPNLPGWKKGKPTGEKATAPVAFSQAEVRYTRGDSRIEMKIVDSGFHQLLLAPYMMFLTSGYERETENGYEKSTRVGNEPGWEKWNTASKSGEVNAVVGKRFLVQAEGRAVDDIKVLHDAIGKANLVKLAAMK